MKTAFIPHRLLEARDEIIARHPGKTRINEIVQKGFNENRKLIQRIVALPSKKLKREAFALSDIELAVIAGYCPSNRFKARLENLHQVLYYRSDQRFWEIYYRAWQDYYTVEENNAFLLKQVKRDEIFMEFMKGYHFDEYKCKKLFGSDDIPHSLGELFYYSRQTIEKKLSERLDFFGIRENTRLYNDCAMQFYTYCSRQEYMDGSKEEIVAAVRKYDTTILSIFLQNFLGKLSLSDLDAFTDLGNYFLTEFGEIGSVKAQKLFEEFSEELRERYADWLNRLKIDEVFGNDERSRFWRQYHFKRIQKYKGSNSVVMEFEKHCVIEFLGKAMGPLYIYEKGYFESKIKNLVYRRMKNIELRQTLLHQTIFLKRIEHFANWQFNTKAYLLNNSITKIAR